MLEHRLSLSPARVCAVLAVIAALLIVVHSAILVVYFYVDDPDQFGFSRLFDIDIEGNIPTLFSAFLFLCNALVLYLIAWGLTKNHAEYPYWLAMAWIFLFLSVDEGARLHEELGDLVEKFVDASGYLYFPWVIPYSLALVIAALIFWRFFMRLDQGLRWRMILSAGLFLSGAILIELLGAKEADLHGTDTIRYSVLSTIEESLEMAGLIVFLHTLLHHLQSLMPSLVISTSAPVERG